MTRTIAPILAFSLLAAGGCDRLSDRWATTENTNVKIDWDKVNDAYKQAEGPADFEKRVNEIYEGSELISVAVQDLDDKSQEVTGFFDTNQSGGVDEGEKVFTIRRDVTGEGAAQYQTNGYGAYYGYYHSPMMSIASGMIMGSMLSSALRPGYVAMYSQPYTTSMSRASELRSQRSSYRAANPSRFGSPKASGSGRKYNSTGRSRGRSGGTRFGVRRRPDDKKPVRLSA